MRSDTHYDDVVRECQENQRRFDEEFNAQTSRYRELYSRRTLQVSSWEENKSHTRDAQSGYNAILERNNAILKELAAIQNSKNDVMRSLIEVSSRVRRKKPDVRMEAAYKLRDFGRLDLSDFLPHARTS